ncbi:MAG: hypothetical protein ACLSE4_09695 [Clostridium sp.]
MVGRDVILNAEKGVPASRAMRLVKVRDLVVVDENGKHAVDRESRSTLRKGEILGIAGVEGNGQTELVAGHDRNGGYTSRHH